jgi:hypothetical protein
LLSFAPLEAPATNDGRLIGAGGMIAIQWLLSTPNANAGGGAEPCSFSMN